MSPLRIRYCGVGLCQGRTYSQVWEGDGLPSRSLCLQPGLFCPTWEADAGCSGGCQGSIRQPKGSLQIPLPSPGATSAVVKSIPLELPAELPLLLLPPPVVLSQEHEDVPPCLMWLQPTEHLDGSWGKVPATTGNRHPRAASSLSLHPILYPHSATSIHLVLHSPTWSQAGISLTFSLWGGGFQPPPTSQ